LTPPVPMPGVQTCVAPGVPLELGPRVEASASPIRIVLLAGEASSKVHQFCDAWKAWGFRPDAVVVHAPPRESAMRRAQRAVRSRGPGALVSRALRGRPHKAGEDVWSNPADFCRLEGIPTLTVSTLSDPSDLEQIRSLRPDLLVHAGAGIVRKELLAIPRLGTLNAHLGLLPQMRGMNVSEWSALCGVPTGASVHCIDSGIDTGDILLFTPVPVDGAASVDELRSVLDRAQVEALGRVVRWIADAGALPPRRPQATSEGRQFFTMHDDVRAVLDAALAKREITNVREPTPVQ
jgi:methionyl-tRNA formyltransferase